MSKAQWFGRITIKPGWGGGRPCVRAQRMRVEDVLELRSAGASYGETLVGHASWERDDIFASVVFSSGKG